MRLKFRLIYTRFLLIAAGFIAIYSLLNYTFIIKPQVYSIPEMITTMVAPLVLVWMPILLWLRPRIKLLILKNSRNNLPAFYYFMAWILISAPCIVTQFYLITATGKLTTLHSIAHITDQPLTKYYSLQQHYIDRTQLATYKVLRVTGKNNQTLEFELYITCPVLDSAPPPDALIHTQIAGYNGPPAPEPAAPEPENVYTAPKAWACFYYGTSMSNRASQADKDAAKAAFWKASLDAFAQRNIDSFTYLDRFGYTAKRKYYRKAVQYVDPQMDADTAILLEAHYAPFADRSNKTEGWIWGSFLISAFIFWVMVLVPKLDEEKVREVSNWY